MIKVKLVAETNSSPEELTSFAAKTCYAAKLPAMGSTIDVKNTLFNTGHHTTLQHSFFTFAIDGISVGALTFGLHLTAPFYNTDQRSGRYSKMYDNTEHNELTKLLKKYFKEQENAQEVMDFMKEKTDLYTNSKAPNTKSIKEYIEYYYPNLDCIDEIISFIENGFQIYSNNLDKAIELVSKQLKEERPFIKEDMLKANSPKVAQELLRNFIPAITGTGLVYTINLSSLTAYYRAAWSPEMKDAFGKMKDIVVQKYPNLAYMFEDSVQRDKDWAPKMDFSEIIVKDSPEVKLISCDIDEENLNLEKMSKDSVDINYFTPEKMNNNVSTIKTEIELSIIIMGHDQRHRTIKRTTPEFTGAFYLPELLNSIPGLKEEAKKLMQQWHNLIKKIPETLATSLAPYGAMVKYQKLSDLNALQHEQAKRTCWCAQEETYWISVLTRKALQKEGYSNLCEIFAPACYNGACIEGRRYCGRDLKNKKEIDFFTHRKV